MRGCAEGVSISMRAVDGKILRRARRIPASSTLVPAEASVRTAVAKVGDELFTSV